MMVLMLTFSVLFLREAGKACLHTCCGTRGSTRVAALRAEADEQQDRRHRRQEAVRRAIAAETEGMHSRRGEVVEEINPPVQGYPDPPVHAYVHVQVEAPRPPPPPCHERQGPFDLAARSSSELPGERPSPPMRGSSSATYVPPPPVPFRGLVGDPPARREVAVQTEESRGITFAELHEIQGTTSTSRTPGVVHLFPGCHALRGVNTNRRQFCRYCLQAAARTGI